MSKYSGADWVKSALRKEMSPFGVQVADLLGQLYQGIYHISKYLDKVNWMSDDWIPVTVNDSDMSTFDFSRLTVLVVLCHDMHIRCQIHALSNWGYLQLQFSPRDRDGDIYKRHPTIEDAVKVIHDNLSFDPEQVDVQ